MTIIKLMPDYYCYLLWHVSSSQFGPINPSDLPLSNETIQRLIAWAKQYDDTLNMNDPPASCFKSSALKAEFIAEGNDLAVLLDQELGSDYKIISKFQVIVA